MKVIWLKSQGEHRPPFCFALLPNEMLTACFHLVHEDRLATPWTPDQVIDDEMHTVLIALVLK